MRFGSKLTLVLCIYGGFARPNHAAEPGHVCLNKMEQSAAVAAHQVLPLVETIKALREHGHRAEVVRAQLCHHNGRLDYVLTMLTRSGKVVRADLDAASGELINGR
jgi:hypothetical protein